MTVNLPGMPDPFNSPYHLPVLSTHGLTPIDPAAPVRLSLMLAFCDFRRAQVARSLECLARQTWRDFEVLVHENGSPLPMDPVYQTLGPFLRLTTMRAERADWSASPTFGFKELLPLVRGSIVAIAQPEVMFKPDAMRLLYLTHSDPPAGSLRYIISNPGVPMAGLPKWGALKVGFLDAAAQHRLDTVDWHSRITLIEGLPGFWTHREGCNCLTNREVLAMHEWPWMLCGSAPRTDRLWEDMPVFRTTIPLDNWLLNYRHARGYVDTVPPGLHGYHQQHLRVWADDRWGENDSVRVPRIRQWAAANGVPLCPAADPAGQDLSPEMTNPTGGPIGEDGMPLTDPVLRREKAESMLVAEFARAAAEGRPK